ncbi:MAG: cytochrome c peroxidase [Candidatus Eisenbacteria bacterium]
MTRGRGLAALGLICLAFAAIGCGSDSTKPPSSTEERPDTLKLIVPGFPRIEPPADNPTTRQGVELGRRLFYDTRLSINRSESCGTCHDPAFAFTDRGRQFSLGAEEQSGDRNAPAVINLAWSRDLFWNGRATGLEAQALLPVENPIEMMEHWPNVVTKLSDDPDYPRLFHRAFGSEEITKTRVVQAIAQFERTLLSYDAKYDRILRGEAAFTESEQRGYRLFFTEKADCFHCHVDITFTDYDFHDNGLDNPPPPARAEVTGNPIDVGAWKTPTLRNVIFTAPYMHDGRFTTLRQVIDHYDSGEGIAESIPFVHFGRGLALSEGDKTDLLNFILCLTDSSFVKNPAFQDPAKAAR